MMLQFLLYVMMKIMATVKLQQMPFSVVLLKQKLDPIWLIQTVIWECYTSFCW